MNIRNDIMAKNFPRQPLHSQAIFFPSTLVLEHLFRKSKLHEISLEIELD